MSSIDNLADRSPVGRLEVAGAPLRYMHNSNWKMFVENLNDTMHPMVAHESSAGTARQLWKDQPADAPKPMVIEQFLPFVSNYEFFDKMGVKIYDNGHSYTGVNFSIHSSYSAIPEYAAQMAAAYGAERAQAILGESRHNTVYYPSLTVKGAIQTIRVVRPIAVDRTLIESFTLRLVGAPTALLARSATYNRVINSPTSVVGHDDLYCYRAIQEGLAADGNEWVSLHRNYSEREKESRPARHPQWHERGVHARAISRLARGDDGRRNGCLMPTVGDDRQLIEFVQWEARLIDEKRFDEWYDLFADDGRYWMPLTRGQPAGPNTRRYSTRTSCCSRFASSGCAIRTLIHRRNRAGASTFCRRPASKAATRRAATRCCARPSCISNTSRTSRNSTPASPGIISSVPATKLSSPEKDRTPEL